MTRTAICPGSFDPVTNGHLDIIRRAANLFDRVIVLVVVNPDKRPSFTAEERVDMIRRAIVDLGDSIEVDVYDGLLVDYVARFENATIVKGLRAVSDFEYEFQMALTNKHMLPQAETIFLTTSAQNMFLSSSLIKQVARFGGDISEFVPPVLHDEILTRLKR